MQRNDMTSIFEVDFKRHLIIQLDLTNSNMAISNSLLFGTQHISLGFALQSFTVGSTVIFLP